MFDEREKHYMKLIKNNLEFFNVGRRKKLTVKYYTDEETNKNLARVLWTHVIVAENLTIQEAHAFVWGFTRGREGR